MKNIIFDWTGVIKDALEQHHAVINLMFKDFGVPPISLKKLRETWKQPFMDFYNMYVPNLTMQEQKKAYFKAYAQVQDSKVYPGMVSLVKKLRFQGKKMVILSSDSPRTIFGGNKGFWLGRNF